MHETLLVAFATMFATVGPLDVGIVFASGWGPRCGGSPSPPRSC